jgi:hypothetical protein
MAIRAFILLVVLGSEEGMVPLRPTVLNNASVASLVLLLPSLLHGWAYHHLPMSHWAYSCPVLCALSRPNFRYRYCSDTASWPNVC